MIETKEIRLEGYQGGDKYQRDLYDRCHGYIQDMTAFGWQPTQETTRRSGKLHSKYQIMARDTSMEHYNDYRRLEIDYETAKGEFKYYSGMEFLTVLLLLVLFIIPGVLYIVFKTNQKKEIGAHNYQCREKMRKAVETAKNIK